jgi:RHS repeat-associated protein
MRRLWIGGVAMLAVACAAALAAWSGGLASAASTCSIYWTGRVSSSWSANGNWSATNNGSSANRLPGRSDYVCMSSAPTRSTVTLTSSAAIDALEWPHAGSVTPTLQLSGSLTVGTTEAAFASTVASLRVTGTLSTVTTLTAPALTLETGGTLAGAGTFTVPSGGSLSIAGGTLAGGVRLVNQGSATVAQNATLDFEEAATLENAASLSLGDSSALQLTYTGRVINAATGTLTYTGSAASSSARIAVPFDNYGAVSVTRGTLELQEGSSQFSTGDSGSYSAAAAGIVEFGGGIRKLANQVTFPGPGQITVSGTLAVAQGTDLTLANLLLSHGSFAGRGTFTIPSGGTADLAGGTLAGGVHLVNRGTIDAAALATTSFREASELQNDGTLKLADGGHLGSPCCEGVEGFLIDEPGATLSYTGSASSSSTTISVPFDNYGAVNVAQGTLDIASSSSGESDGDTGSYTTAAAGKLEFSSGLRTLASSATFQGAGQVVLAGAQLGLDAGTNLSLANLLVSGSTLTGHGSIVIPTGGSATLASGTTLAGGFRLVNRGNMTIATGSGVFFTDASVLENAGTLALSDGDQVGSPCCSEDADGTLSDDPGASLDYTGSASNSATSVDVRFDNFGTVAVGRGTLELENGSSTHSAGDSGVYNVAATAILRFAGTRLFKGVSFPGAGEVEADGTLDFLANATLPSLAWPGTIDVAPGSIVTATVIGTPSGTLQVEGDRPGHYGSFVATGSLNVGSLYLAIANEGFTPPCGETILSAKSTSLSGSFAYVSDEQLPESASLQTSYTSTSAKTLIDCPPPPLAAAQTYGTGRSFDVSNPSGYFAEPVNTATGAYATEQTDAALHSLGFPFAFTRYYSSDNTASGPLGPGWSSSLSASLTPEGSTVILTSENGQQATFTEQAEGVYAGGPGVRSRLTKTAGGWTVTRRDRTELNFDTTGKLLSITDGNGIGVKLAYNSGGQLETATDSAGHTVTFAYNSAGLLTSIALPLSRTIHYAYSAAGRLASVTDAAGDVTSYTYNSAGLLASILDANSHTVVQNTYNSSGQVVSQTNALGKKSTFSYGSESTTFTDPLGHKWVDHYAGGVLVKRTDPLGDTTTYAYDSNLDLTAVTDPNGNTTLMSYDGAGNMLDRTSPAPFDYEESWIYNSLDEPLTFTDRRGLNTTYSYDARGNLLKTTRPDGTSLANTYSATTGARLSSTDAAGHTTKYAYDAAGDLVEVVSPAGETTTYGYDAAGRLTSSVSPRGHASGANPAQFTTTYAYDPDDRLVTVTDPLGDTTTTTYDKVGNIASVTNPDNHTTSYSYDAANHLVKITAPDGSVTESTYDAAGNLSSRIDPNGHTTSSSYDAANRLSAVKTPLGHTTSYSYDRDGNRIETLDATGASTTYTYDALNRLTAKTYSDGTPTVKYSYDADSNRISMSDATGTTTYTYNSRNQLTKKTHGGASFTYTYKPDGEIATRTYPDSASTTYAYDADGRLESATSGAQTTTYAYDPDGDLVKTTLPAGTGVSESRSYDDADRLAGIEALHGATTLDAYAITRDAAGNPTALSTPGGPVKYAYDSRERILEACYGVSCATGKETWTYDGVGNRLTSTVGGVTTKNTYNADNEIEKSVTGESTITPTYDADDRLTGYGANTYSWNAANQLTAVGGPHAATYGYDGDGNRATVTSGGATTTQTWDTNGALAQLASSQSAAGTQNYLWGAGSLGFTTAAGAFYALHDEQGSTVGVVGATGTLQSSATYDPFGVTIATTKPVSTAPTDQIGWQEQLAEPSGQYDLRARQYEPASGQFLTPDPRGGEAGAPAQSAYIYAGDMPTVGSDPSGECALGIFGHGCSTTGKIVFASLSAVAFVGTLACDGVSFGTFLPCDAATVASGASVANDLYDALTPSGGSGGGSASGEGGNYYTGYDNSNVYNDYGGNTYSSVYGDRAPSK